MAIISTTINYVVNPSFEVNTVGWSGNASTIARMVMASVQGVAAGECLTNGTSGSGIYIDPPAVGTWAAGNPVSAAAWVKAPVGANMEMLLTIIGGGNTGTVGASFVGTGNWELIKIQGGVITGPITTAPYLFISRQGVHTGATFYVDMAAIYRSATAPEPFDGSTLPFIGTSFTWTGTAHASASTKTVFDVIDNMSNGGRKLWWFGQETKFSALPMPASGAQVRNVGYYDSLDYVGGRKGISRSMQTHKEVTLDFPVQEAGTLTGLDNYTRYAQGYWGDCDSYPMFFADPMLFDQNLLPPNWASPGLVKRGWSDISPNFGVNYDNLAINPSAETNLTGWAAINGTSGVTTLTRPDLGVNAPSGRFVARVTWTTATTVVSGGISYTGIATIAGFTRNYSIAVRSSKIQRVQMTVRFRDAGNASIGTAVGTATVLAANTNTRLEVLSAVPPVGSVSADIEVVAVAGTSGTNWAINNTFDGDAVMVYPSSDGAPPAYFDGDTPGAFWQGTPNASASRMYMSRQTPTFSVTVANSYQQPPQTATFQIVSGANSTPASNSLTPYALIPIPPGYTLWMGASGSATGTARVVVDMMNTGNPPTVDNTTALPLQAATSATRLSTSFANGEYAKVYINRTSTVASTITLTSMMAQLWPTGVTPVTTGNHIQGGGYRGMKFTDGATEEEYVFVDRNRNVPVRYKAMSTTLAEAQDKG